MKNLPTSHLIDFADERRIPVVGVQCPRCKVKVGSLCVTPRGGNLPTTRTHRTRIELALNTEADRLEERERESYRKKEESFARCDTDGFLSQWAHGITGQLQRREAQIIRDGGVIDKLVLLNQDGVIVADYIHYSYFQGHHRPSWAVYDEHVSDLGRKWIPVGERSRIQKKLGLREETRTVKGWAKIGGSGTGLSGAANAHVVSFPILGDDRRVQIVKEG